MRRKFPEIKAPTDWPADRQSSPETVSNIWKPVSVIGFLVALSVGLWLGIRWAYIIEIGILGALAIASSIIAVDSGKSVPAIIGSIAAVFVAYLCASPTVRQFYDKNRSLVARVSPARD